MSAYLPDRRVEKRYDTRLDAKVLFKASPQATKFTVKSVGHGLTMVGATNNLSENGVGLVISARNIDRYLTSAEYTVWVELKLPTGPINFTVRAVRHERVAEGKTANKYFIAANIVEISETDKSSLSSYLRTLG
ncbi:MAG: PilZ domain-containing protein [Pyrinomonadaceae bacterium]